MMNKHNWIGKWIGSGMSIEDRFAPIFKKEFCISRKITQAKAYICGLGLFELKINGCLPDDSVLNPAHTQYSQTVLYRVFDVADFLEEGKNTVTVELGHSFLNETTTVWNWHTASWRSTPKLIMDLIISYDDGTYETFSTDESWLVTLDGPTRKNSIYLGETHDARCVDFSWQNAKCVDAPQGELKEQYMPPIRRIAEFKPQEIRCMPNGSYVVTAPEMITGWAKIRIDAPKDTEITVTYNEQLTKDGYVRKIGKGEGRDGNWWPEAYIQQDKFISNGEPFEFEPKFSYKGFRYFQIDNLANLTDADITICRVANDVDIVSEFACSDEMINKLHALMRRTMLNNFQGKPTDTPVWEKNGWLGDANCALTTMMYNFDMRTYLASFIDIMADCLHEFGSVPVMVPSANWSVDNSPVWNTVFVFGAEALMDFYGVSDYLKNLYPDLKAFAEKDIAELEVQGMVWGIRGLADWLSPIGGEDIPSDPNTSEGAEICGTGFIYAMLKSMIRIAEKLGKTEDIEIYKTAAEKIRAAFNEKFYNPDLGIYETTSWAQKGLRTKYRQTSNLISLAFGLVAEENKKAVLQNLVNDVAARDYHLDTGCIGTKFILPVLFDNGCAEAAFKVLTQTTYPSWGFWLENGANSAWESWEKTTRSMNHYFLATYDEILYSHIAGIRSIRDGFKAFTVSPVLDCGLEFAKASIKSPLGTVRCEWQKNNDGGFTVEIEIPEGATAEVILSDKIKTVQSGGCKTYNI